MNRPRLLRALRITWSVAWGTAAVLLVALWVRSYWRTDTLVYVSPGLIRGISSALGITMLLENNDQRVAGPAAGSGWRYGTIPMNTPSLHGHFFSGFIWNNRPPTTFIVSAPDWFVVLALITTGAVPWLRYPTWHFSLRTLLIATTLIAVVLGLIVWLK